MEYGFEGGAAMTVFWFEASVWGFTAHHFGSMEGEEVGEGEAA
jgi:hypothetical protein